MSRTITLIANVLLPFGALVVSSGPVGAQDHGASPESALSAYDTDKDGTIDENEARTAAGAAFDRLDTDKDGTLDEKELQGHLSKAQFREADPDNDGTITKNEYVVFVVKTFKSADPDGDGTLDARELQTPAGRVLIRLMR